MNEHPPNPSAEGGLERFDVEPVNKKENRSLYKPRERIHPKRVKGTFRTFKWLVMAVTLGIYYITPWLRWDRGAGAPDQAVLIDFPARRFYFFFIEIWPQEIYYIAGILILAGIGLFLVTSVFGRAWCGYSCPQTVWVDLFLVVERAVEGDRSARIRLDQAPMTSSKAVKRILKHIIWLLIAMLTGGAWVFYYADAPTLAVELVTLSAQPVAYITIAVLTFTTYTLGALMREQVCTYMCPWPRIQGAMMDEESLTVTYRADRGEPRMPYRKGETWDDRGDCIECNACVVSCPMGIDIRDGQQFECITCSLCIDACDDVMRRIDRPRGLIDYDSLANAERRAQGDESAIRFFRPRTLIYFGILTLVGGVMVAAFLTRSDTDINVLHDRNPLFTRLSDGSIRNGYTFKVLNKARVQRTFAITADGIDGVTMGVVGSQNLSGSAPFVTVRPDRVQSFRLLVTAPKESLSEDSHDIRFVLENINTRETATYDSIFRGPK
ncbi:MAG: cytochrome c oxidase accessory protein CcoG [Rhodospirillales bacterium]|nr:cytochrome c oxidase accessory protein CcoG [Alphaproteobacteria bacterium]MBL6948020.1 cytochrome c oxidase accessory protein CcoG [Rhodospirillales bacterium]